MGHTINSANLQPVRIIGKGMSHAALINKHWCFDFRCVWISDAHGRPGGAGSHIGRQERVP